jgi:dienelactone hydrolase
MRAKLTAVCLAAALPILVAIAGCGNTNNGVGPAPAKVDGALLAWGVPPSGSPKAVVMLIPGGGWEVPNPGFREMKASAPTIQQHGYATVAIRYGAGSKAVQQVQDVYRAAQRQFPGTPICATGVSAGGHLALMLATREPSLKCVVALSSPTDLTTLAGQGGQLAHQLAVKAFGANRLAEFSPVNHAKQIKARVMLINADADPVVPVEQGRELKAALPRTQLTILPPGPVPAEFAHFGGVQADAATNVLKQEFAFIKSATG